MQDWILKSLTDLYFFSKQINPSSLKSWCVKGTRKNPVCTGEGFFGCFDAAWLEWSWIDLVSKETQIRIRFKNPILDFLRGTHPELSPQNTNSISLLASVHIVTLLGPLYITFTCIYRGILASERVYDQAGVIFVPGKQGEVLRFTIRRRPSDSPANKIQHCSPDKNACPIG